MMPNPSVRSSVAQPNDSGSWGKAMVVSTLRSMSSEVRRVERVEGRPEWRIMVQYLIMVHSSEVGKVEV